MLPFLSPLSGPLKSSQYESGGGRTAPANAFLAHLEPGNASDGSKCCSVSVEQNLQTEVNVFFCIFR